MAEVVVIDVQAKFTDNMTPGMGKAKSGADKFEDSLKKMQKQIDKLGSQKAKPEIGIKDNATKAIEKVYSAAKRYGGSTFRGVLKVADYATAPLRAIKNHLFSIKTLIAGVATGFAANKLISGPIALADQIEQAQIGFETMLGSVDKAVGMMDKIKDFAAKTPFDTTGVISSVQQMLRAGWTVDNVMQDMEKIGNAAAAAGQGTEGVQGIVLALQQMRMAGKVNSQDMMQMINRGIDAWGALARGMGKSIQEVREMSKDGAIDADTAIAAIMKDLESYDGMMQKMSNRTVKGLMSNIQDTFDIKIVEKWGKGLAVGATAGLGRFADWLDKIDPLLQRAGTSLFSLGRTASEYVFGVFDNSLGRLEEVMNSDEFIDGSMGTKMSLIWKKVISEPFGEWWDQTMNPKVKEKAASIGENLGSGASGIIKGLLGIDPKDEINEAASIGGAFAQGFLKGFDGAGIKERLKEIIHDAFMDALKVLPGGDSPTASSWLSAGILAYGGAKILGPIIGAGKVLGKVGGKLAPYFGPKLTLGGAGATMGGLGGLGGGLGSAGLGAAGTAGLGTAMASVFGGFMGAVAAGRGIADVYHGYKSDDATEKKSSYAKGGGKLGGAAAGAGIGALIGGPLGALIGAGVGGLGGWIAGDYAANKIKKNAEAANFATKEMQETVKDTTLSAEELKEKFKQACSKDVRDHFGDITLSLEDMQKAAQNIVYGKTFDKFTRFDSAAKTSADSIDNLAASREKLNRMTWKASLGVAASDEDKQAILETVDTYISDAKTAIENKHYEISAAIDILIDPENEQNGALQKQTNAYYQNLQNRIDSLGEQYKAKYKLFLENDGVIDPTEGETLAKIQESITKITNKVSEAEYEAKIETIKIKYGDPSSLTSDSFKQMQEEIQKAADEKANKLETALTATVTSLKLQMSEDPDNAEMYQSQIDELGEKYRAEIKNLNAEVTGFQLSGISEAYSKELDGILPELKGTTAEKLSSALNNAIASGSLGENPVDWKTEDMIKWFGLEGLKEEAQTNITEMMREIASGMPEKLKSAIETDENFASLNESLFDYSNLLGGENAEFAAKPNVRLEPNVVNWVESAQLVRDDLRLGVESGDVNANSHVLLKTTDNSAEQASEVRDRLQSEVESKTKNLSVTSNLYITVDTMYKQGKISDPAGVTLNRAKRLYGPDGFASGGFVTGGKQLSWLDEEGKGEVVIPFSPARRSRALDLWEKTGKMLGVQEHKEGGFIGRAMSDNISAPTANSSGNNVKVDIGNITLEVKTDGNSAPDIMSALKSKEKELSIMITRMINNAFKNGFENLPLADQS